jgi:putative oxidoreductase
MMSDHKMYIAELLVRTFAGILFLFQGYDKLFRIKMHDVIEVFKTDAESYHVPRPLLNLLAYYTSIAEFFGGILLLSGLFINYALYAIGLDIILVCAAFTYMTPMWNMKYVFPRFILVITLLMVPTEWHYYSLDRILGLLNY